MGSRFAFEAKFLGRRLSYVYEVREYRPAEVLVMSTDDGPVAMETTYCWLDGSDGGTMMRSATGGPRRAFRVFSLP